MSGRKCNCCMLCAMYVMVLAFIRGSNETHFVHNNMYYISVKDVINTIFGLPEIHVSFAGSRVDAQQVGQRHQVSPLLRQLVSVAYVTPRLYDASVGVCIGSDICAEMDHYVMCVYVCYLCVALTTQAEAE